MISFQRRGGFSAPAALLLVASLLAGCAKSTTSSVIPATPGHTESSATAPKPLDFRTALSLHLIARACDSSPGRARCSAWIALNGPSASPSGYGPADLQSAYGIASAAASNGSGATIAIVDAYDDPNAEADLAVYRAHYGLSACTTASGCFKKVNQSGVQGSYPAAAPSRSWALEMSLDLDMVSANCPNCSILLVEASTSGIPDLAAAAVTASTFAGVKAISNSYVSQETLYGSYAPDYQPLGILVTAGSGDPSSSPNDTPWFPADVPTVVAVGGTSLLPASNARGWSETAWSGSNSGCSAVAPQPSWQSSVSAITSVCSMRAIADVSYDGDPTTPVVFYDTYDSPPGGWWNAGGTSVGAPSVAAIYGGLGAGFNTAQQFYDAAATLNDVTSGSNGACGTDLCVAQAGWDGPTGLGTPNGVFQPPYEGGPCSCPPPIAGRPQQCVNCATPPPLQFGAVARTARRKD